MIVNNHNTHMRISEPTDNLVLNGHNNKIEVL